MKIRKSSSRGFLKNNWIESRRLFSNNSYWDPNYMNYKHIHVINDDILQPGNKIPKHEHINYEILGYIVSGELEHWDSEGNITNCKHGQIQHMSCGKSIFHTEKCVSDIPARYLQIWIKPSITDTNPYYELIEKSFEFGKISINLNQKISIRSGILNGRFDEYITDGYIYIIDGRVTGSDFELSEGDSVEIIDEKLQVDCINAHILIFEFEK